MKKIFLLSSLAGAALLTGCMATSPEYQSSYPVYQAQPTYQTYQNNYRYYGTVENIRFLGNNYNGNLGVGALTGAALGGLVGSQIGGGDARIASAVVGAAAGGYVGHQIERNRGNYQNYMEVTIRLDNGQRVTITQPDNGDRFVPGQRIAVIGQGSDARVVR